MLLVWKLIRFFIPPAYRRKGQGILLSAFALTVSIQFSLIISVLVINSRAMGPTWTNHGDGHTGIERVKN
jgi:hypothetical protein